MSEGNRQHIGTVKDKQGNYTTIPEETLKVLFDEHFPSRDPFNEVETPELDIHIARGNIELIDSIVSKQAIRTAFKTFDPVKSPGMDAIYPILVQVGIEELITPLEVIYRRCLKEEKIPKIWEESRVAFIPKPGKTNYSEPNHTDRSASHHSYSKD